MKNFCRLVLLFILSVLMLIHAHSPFVEARVSSFSRLQGLCSDTMRKTEKLSAAIDRKQKEKRRWYILDLKLQNSQKGRSELFNPYKNPAPAADPKHHG